MRDIRPLSQKNPYSLPKEEALTVYHYCRCYPEWEKELRSRSLIRGVSYDQEKVQGNRTADATADQAIRNKQLADKLQLIDEAIMDVIPEVSDYMKRNICYGVSFHALEMDGLPMCREAFYKYRQKTYKTIALRM